MSCLTPPVFLSAPGVTIPELARMYPLLWVFPWFSGTSNPGPGCVHSRFQSAPESGRTGSRPARAPGPGARSVPGSAAALAHSAQKPRRPRQGRSSVCLHGRGAGRRGRGRDRGVGPTAAARRCGSINSRSPCSRCRRPGRDRCGTGPSSSAPGRRGWWPAISWRSRAISRWCWNAAGQCAIAFTTCTPSTPAGRSIRKAIISLAKAGPAPSATAS